MDRSLATLLRSLQTSIGNEDAVGLLPSATSLLTRLSNPLNLTLLSQQILSTDLLYGSPVDLESCRTIFSVFYTATLRYVEDREPAEQSLYASKLSVKEWTRAVVRGADTKSPTWRHSIMLGALLYGFNERSSDDLPSNLRGDIEAAIVTAVNASLRQREQCAPNSSSAVVFVLNTVFSLLSDYHRGQIEYDLLLPELVDTVYFSRDGLEYGYWLGFMNDEMYTVNGRLRWEPTSNSGKRLSQIKNRMLVASLGHLARLMAHSIENVQDAGLIVTTLSRLNDFCHNIALSWRRNRLCEIPLANEHSMIEQHTRQTTLADLWQMLKNIYFATIICLRSVLGRVLLSAHLSSDPVVPTLATQILHILRDTYFIAHRAGQQSSSQSMFVMFTSIDVLNSFPNTAENFVSSIKPLHVGTIPQHPVDRLGDLFYLNTAEHLTLALPTQAAEQYLVTAAVPYITPEGNRDLSELYEAAHSLFLAVFAAPQNGALAARHIPYYVETLLHSFPHSLDPRQFKLAIKSIMQLSSSGSGVAQAMPHLQEVVLDMLRQHFVSASEQPLPHAVLDQKNTDQSISEKYVLLQSIIQNLSFLSPAILQEWLCRTAELVQTVHNPVHKGKLKAQFWEILSSGQMDVERAAVCVTWWTTSGGRELLLFGEKPSTTAQELQYEMSGAVQGHGKL